MSVTASPAQTAPRPSQPGPVDVEASCRIPLLGLFGSGVFWLFVASLLALMASLKFHNPHFLAGSPYWTYGRVQAAASSTLLYGFAVPSALGVGLWLLCRLGRAPLVGPLVATLGVLVWNSAVVIGIIGILCGDSTGFASFELPRYCSVLLLVGYLLIAVCGALTFHFRQEGPLYPSQWFVLGSLFWFPWIFSTAAMLLLCMPVRGVVQSSIAWWFAHNFHTVFLGFAGLASIFYFIPKLLGRPLHSYYLAALTFWTLAFFGSWGGIPDGAPLPAWVISMGVIGTVFTLIPVIGVALNFCHTVRQDLNALDANPTLRFTYVGLIFWLIASVHQIVGVLPHVSALTNFTWFTVAQKELFEYGFFAMTMFGAIYYITPLLFHREHPPTWSPGLLKGHFWLTLVGILISYLALLVGGIGEGILLSNPGYLFPQIMHATLGPLRADTMGILLVAVGLICFLLNFALLMTQSAFRYWSEWCDAERKEAR
jgi:cytochrome c oxidase cbb3-type subunit 1